MGSSVSQAPKGCGHIGIPHLSGQLGHPSYPLNEPGQAVVDPGEQGGTLLGHVQGHLTTLHPEQLQLRLQDGCHLGAIDR